MISEIDTLIFLISNYHFSIQFCSKNKLHIFLVKFLIKLLDKITLDFNRKFNVRYLYVNGYEWLLLLAVTNILVYLTFASIGSFPIDILTILPWSSYIKKD